VTSTSAAPDLPPEGIGLAAFNALPAERARGLLLGWRRELRSINDLRLTKLIGP
jgi:hypothetical protein